MTVETVSYISDLNTALPASGDSAAEGDDHIRNIKVALKQTFPNINAAMTATDEILNGLDGRVTALQNDTLKYSTGLLSPINGNGVRITNINTDYLTGSDACNVNVVNSLIATAILVAKQALYPVGSLYYNAVNASNPATFMGFGTWVQYGGGTFIMAAGTFTDARGEYRDYSGAGEKAGGEYQHVLTTAEMPAHTHTFQDTGSTLGVNPGGTSVWNTHSTGTTGSAGAGAAHNNVPPYSVVYVWRRTA